jgi:PAS domain S-box-containing protein
MRDHDDQNLDPRVRERLATLEQAVLEERGRHAAAEADARRYRLFLDSVQDYAFITFNHDLRVIGWSRGAEIILGYPEADAIGLHSGTFFTPEDLAREEHLKEAQRARDDGSAEDERWHLRRDGTRFWGSGVMTSLHDEAENLQGYSKVLRDHTARRMAEMIVRDSEARLRMFTENVHDYALVPVDPEGQISGWNPGAERIFGYTEAEVIGTPVYRLFGDDEIGRRDSDRDLEIALAEGRAEDERWMFRKDGSRLWSRWVTTPMWDPQGSLRGYAKVLHDETARKAAEELREALLQRERQVLHHRIQSTGEALDRTKEELRALAGSLIDAQEEERRRIARDLHDDLSQRLAVLRFGLSKLRGSLSDTSLGELDRLDLQVETLARDVRRLSHKLHPAILDDLGLGAALRRLAEEFSEARPIAVTFIERDVPQDLPTAVSAALYRVAQEALRNIGKHAAADPIVLSLVGEDGELHLGIVDSGPGFDVTAVRGRGGLGIISMQERLRLIGGVVQIESIPGQGTTVLARVPLTKETP